MKTYEELLSDIEDDMELMGALHIVYAMEENGVLTGYDYLPEEPYTISVTLKDLQEKIHQQMLYDFVEEYKFQILAMEAMPDHIHLLVDCRPQFYISDMIKIMKGNIARQMFLAHPELKKELWGGHLWNPSYCAVTVSDKSREQVCSYIEGQKEK